MLPSHKTKHALRNIHALFQPFLAQNAHGYCVIYFEYSYKLMIPLVCGIPLHRAVI
jgi:hypothetical protein